ncbi:MAG: ABC transporter ATP-binding protein [Vicinamibacterales bacterium]|nr:ABC transporter ATP-binding protein [Vicinamibacterales bacterium]
MIRFDGVSKRFGTHVAVESLSLDVAPGTALALLGPNGSGKTTSLKVAAGLVRPTAGRVLVGRPPRDAREPEARQVTTFLPQKVTFPEALTGIEVARFYGALRDVSGDRVREALKAVALNGAAPRAVGTYSGGMVQRLGLAVALLPDAPLMLLDEPTAALDPDGLCAFYAVVDRHKADGRTLVFTSHQLGDVERLADRIAILVNGRLVADLTQDELVQQLADRGVMRVRLSARPDGLLARVRTRAPGARWAGDDLVVPGPATARAGVMALVQASGADVHSLTAEEGRLDAFYRELVGEHT